MIMEIMMIEEIMMMRENDDVEGNDDCRKTSTYLEYMYTPGVYVTV